MTGRGGQPKLSGAIGPLMAYVLLTGCSAGVPAMQSQPAQTQPTSTTAEAVLGATATSSSRSPETSVIELAGTTSMTDELSSADGDEATRITVADVKEKTGNATESTNATNSTNTDTGFDIRIFDRGIITSSIGADILISVISDSPTVITTDVDSPFTATDSCPGPANATAVTECSVRVSAPESTATETKGVLYVRVTSADDPTVVESARVEVVYRVPQTETPTGRPAISVSPNPITARSQSLTLNNTGDVELEGPPAVSFLNTTTYLVAAVDSHTCDSLAPGASCTVRVSWKNQMISNITTLPMRPGPHQGTLTVSYGGVTAAADVDME